MKDHKIEECTPACFDKKAAYTVVPWIRHSNLIEEVDDAKEDARSIRAYKWFLKQPLDLTTILDLHDKVMEKKLSRYERGHWRKCAVIVGGRLCPHHSMVPGLMQAWITCYSKSATEEMIRQAHIEFEKIHPFVDGNGRTGRMIMNWQRQKAGLKPLLIRYDARGEYYQWFKGKPSLLE